MSELFAKPGDEVVVAVVAGGRGNAAVDVRLLRDQGALAVVELLRATPECEVVGPALRGRGLESSLHVELLGLATREVRLACLELGEQRERILRGLSALARFALEPLRLGAEPLLPCLQRGLAVGNRACALLVLAFDLRTALLELALGLCELCLLRFERLCARRDHVPFLAH